MRIDRIELKNFRCFEHLEVEFHPEFNVIIGGNGSGKTALLEACAIAIDNFASALIPRTPRSIEGKDVRAIPVMHEGQIIFELQPPSVVTAEAEIVGYRRRWTHSMPPDREEEDRAFGAINALAMDTSLEVRAGDPVTIPIITYYGTQRLREDFLERIEIPLKQTDLSRLTSFQDCVDGYVNVSALMQYIEFLDRIAYQERKEPATYRPILEAMAALIERATKVVFDVKRLELVIEFEDGSHRPFGQLSDGQQLMAALAGDLAMRIARSNLQFGKDVLTETPGVVLIDELDLHLHPHWQRHVVADLRKTFPKVQFIVTTHSPQILSEVEPECVRILTNEDGQFAVHQPNQSYGLDTDGVLRLMGARSRPKKTQDLIDATDVALEDGELDIAREKVKALRVLLHGDDPEVARLDAYINNLEALASDAVD